MILNQTEAMPCVTLEQYGRSAQALALTGGQRSAIRDSGLVSAVEVEEGRYQLKGGSSIGTALLPSLRVIVRPRFKSLGNVFFLLGYGDGITKWGAESFPYEVDQDFFRAMVWLFEAEVANALRFGIIRGYEEREAVLSTLRGRIDVATQLREVPGRPYPLACRFVEFLADTELNRMIKQALQEVRRLPGLDDRLALRLRHHLAAFTDVADVPLRPRNTPLPSFNRLNEHWRGASVLARMVLDRKTVIDRHGHTQGITFSVDMNTLFEEFIRTVVSRIARKRGFELAPTGTKPRFSNKARMKPDLIIRLNGVNLAVGDAKYKKIVPEGDVKWSHANLYQLLAYCIAMELDGGILIYAESEGAASAQETEGVAKELRTEEVSLGGEPAEILARAERVAHQLVDQAAEKAAGLGLIGLTAGQERG